MKNLIPEQTLEEIRSRADIVEVVSEYVPLKAAGKNHKGLCPFHQEKTPSFTANREKQIYHCFGCGAGGNVFRFIMEMEDLSFVEAVRKLAERYHVALPDTGQASQVPGERAHLLGMNLRASQYFNKLLKDPAGKAAREYIYSRGFDDRVIDHFQIGWAPDEWRRLLTHLETQAKCPRQKLEAFGLVTKKEGQDEKNKEVYYDRFRGRIMFPITDPQGNVIGFGGRVLGDGEPKYLNSPETLVYKKGNHLYGLHQAREAIRREKQVLVMEGYFDQIRAWQHGSANAVATCGTALTPRQGSLLKQHTDTAVLVFDADAAGQSAAERGYQVLAEAGLSVRVVELPAGHDPDTLIQAEGGDAFRKRVAEAAPFPRYFIRKTARSSDTGTPEGRLEALNQVLPLLNRIQNSVERSEYALYAAETLGVEEKSLREELKKAVEQHRPRVQAAPKAPEQGRHEAEFYLVHLMLTNEDIARQIRREASLEHFPEGPFRETAGLLFEWLDQGEPLRVDRLLDRVNRPEIKSVLTRVSLAPIDFDNLSRATADCLATLRRRALKSRIEELKKQRNEAERAGQSERSRELHEQVNKMRLSLIP